jgi:hypothetical protein
MSAITIIVVSLQPAKAGVTRWAIVKFGHMLEQLRIHWYLNKVIIHVVQSISRKGQYKYAHAMCIKLHAYGEHYER